MTYIDNPPTVRWHRGALVEYPGHFWRAHTLDRLAFLYGHERARRIMGGADPAANADLAAWNNLGQRSAA